MRIRKALAPLSSTLLALLSATSAWSAPSSQLVAPAAAGQQALAVAVVDDRIVAKVCPSPAGCNAAGAAAIEVPAEAVPLVRKGVRFDAVKLQGGRHLMRVIADGGATGASFTVLVAAPLAGKGEEPIIIWSGFTGLSKGEYGEERVNVVVEEKLGDGARIVVGERRNDVTICGRPAIVAAKEVDPATMTLKRGASVQSLTESERTNAPKLTAKLVTDPKPLPIVPLLRAQTASSAVGKAIGTLTDGDVETSWSEAKTGIGAGEFASMSSSSDIGISSLEIVVRPAKADVADGTSPKQFYLATHGKLFEVTLPEDAWRKPGARFEIALPEEVTASCVSLVLDTAFAPANADSARVTVSEVVARTPLDDKSPEALVEMLAGGDARAKAAAALLTRAGNPGAEAAMKSFDKLDEPGQRLAEGVIDGAPCSVHAPFYVRLMGEKLTARGPKKSRDVDPALEHATDRVRRCGRAAVPALSDLIAKGTGHVKLAAAAELALIAPAESVPVLIEQLATTDDDMRREMRALLSHAAKSERAWSVFAVELEPERFSSRTDVVKVDILRALGARIVNVTGARDVFISLWAPEASFRTRYLLLGPAAELARSGDERAKSLVLEALRKDPDPHVRTKAAQVAGRVPELLPGLIEAVDDPEVRVREAAVEALGARAEDAAATPPSVELVAALERRLQKDPFTFVRVHAARSLGQLPAAPNSDAALATALRDAAPEVRARAIDGLATHRAKKYIAAIGELADRAEENPEVRARAILALGVLCDASRIDAWTKLSLWAASGMSDGERMIGAAAIAALGDVKPKDLPKRLAPLLDPKMPRNVREAAKAALEAPGVCK